MESILLPTKFEITPSEKPNEGVLVLEPCYYGYGTTIGNALRRVLLSSLPGAAVTAVKIKGAQHEFSSIPNVKEDVLEIILNMKSLRLRLHNDEPTRLTLKVTGDKIVTAGDFEKNSNVDIVNPDMPIATITSKKGEFELEAVIERGRGYSSTESRPRMNEELGMIMIDSLFSPVRTVGYRVENARVGETTNYDRLLMTIETDGTITPEAAVEQSAGILEKYVGLLLGKGVEQEMADVEEETFDSTDLDAEEGTSADTETLEEAEEEVVVAEETETEEEKPQLEADAPRAQKAKKASKKSTKK